MDNKTKIALEGSIKHWKRVVKSPNEECGTVTSCSLCHEFNYGGVECNDCPVYQNSEETGCHNTPVAYLNKHMEETHLRCNHRQPYCKECLRLAREELKFLESLREDLL